jgi:hypothetical protein
MSVGSIWQALTGVNDICRFCQEADGTWRQFWNDEEIQREMAGEKKGSRLDLKMIEAFPQLESETLFQRLSSLEMNDTIIAATINGQTCRRADGLVEGIPYTILAAIRISPLSGKSVRLVLMRSPWAGNAVDGESQPRWNGAWSNGSDLWESAPEVQRQVSGLFGTMSNATFWMSWDDFGKIFGTIEALQLPQDFSRDFAPKREGVARQVGARLLNMKQGTMPVEALSPSSPTGLKSHFNFKSPGRMHDEGMMGREINPRRMGQGEADILPALSRGYGS